MNDSDRLAIALAASKPLEIERLLTDYQRRTVSVEEHQAFRDSIAARPAVDEPAVDHVDELAAAPAVDRLPARRSESQVNRVLELLDSLPPAAGERRSA